MMRPAPLVLMAGAGLLSTAVALLPDEVFRHMAETEAGVVEWNIGDKDVVILPHQFGQMGTSPSKINDTETNLTPRSVLDILLGRARRGGSCDAGEIRCTSGCAPEGSDCCTTGYCASGKKCCESGNGCIALDSTCCRDGSYCPAGNHCYESLETNRGVCCTDSQCTAYVKDGATVELTRTRTRTRTTSALDPATTLPPQTTTEVSYQAYYFTVTWYYYYYYWYTIDITRSVVTSSRTYESSLITVSASNSADATSSFEYVTSTFSPTTPAAATSLASLAGSTVGGTPSATSAPPTPTTTSAAGTTEAESINGGGFTIGGSEDSTTSSTGRTTSTTSSLALTYSERPLGTTINGGLTEESETSASFTPQVNAANSWEVKFGGDRFLGVWMIIAAATGIVMVAL